MNDIFDMRSRWWKIDFHVHSPASNDYGRGDDSLKNIEPEAWLQKAMEAGLDCVVLSDHNSGDWIDRLKVKNKELQKQDNKPDWFRELTIFPGVEITVAESSSRVHLLAVFDPSCCSQTITSVLGSCGITSGLGDDEQTATSIGFCKVVEKISKAGGISIAAHIDGEKGLMENAASLTPELEKSLQTLAAAEFRDLHKFDQTESSLKKAVDRLAKLGGSDAHKPDHIGRHFSWLKMSKPSIEGLRLALMDHQHFVKNQDENPNSLPDLYLSRLTVKNMSHCGRIKDQPFSMSLHPHFNAIIGGRGAGKSTVLESIRIAACRDQNLAAEAPKIKSRLDKFIKLSQGKEGVMLKETEILLELHRRGKDFQLRWRYDGQGHVLEEKSSDGSWQEIEQGDLHERFPLSIYSQKQIDELAANPRGLLEIVDRAPNVNHAEWKSRWDGMESQFLQIKERSRELSRQLAEEPQLRVKLNDVENDLRQYAEKGHGAILKQYQKRIQQKNSLPSEQVFDDLSSGIRELACTAELSDFPVHLFDEQEASTTELRAIHEQAGQELKAIAESLGKLAEQVDELNKKRQEAITSSRWQQSVQESIALYEGLVKEYEQKSSTLSDYGKWVQQRNELQQKLNKIDSVKKEKELLEREIEDKLNGLLALRTELFTKRNKFLNEVIENNKYVRMDLVQFGDVSSLEEDYRALLNIADKHNSSVLDEEGGILHKLHNWHGSHQKSELPQLIQEIKERTRAITEGRDSSCHGKFCNKLKEILQNQPAVFDQLDAWWPKDMLRVKHSRDGKFDDLEKGSAGQKAAAILAFLLSHGNEPLIIDQPEDDLDNALIYELIVKQIHANKERRQLVIVTHNPNIVVNGDAELVHVLKFANGQVLLDMQGGLEEMKIRTAVCDIMEGGKEAFEKRYKRMTLESARV
jgi:DNA repair exonuclease SbcCD ATPase subunit